MRPRCRPRHHGRVGAERRRDHALPSLATGARLTLSDDLLWLCRIPSFTGEEHALSQALARRLGALELPRALRVVRESLVVPVLRGSGGPKVALVGHLDVVRTRHDGPPRVEGDRLYGAGAADMKSGLALMLDIAQDPPAARLDLSLVFYAGEEGSFQENQLGDVLERESELRAVDIAVALEPCDNALELGCGGSTQAAVRFRGTSAHSSRPWQGENAIHKAAPLLARLSALPAREHVIDGLTWVESTSATLAHGGVARNVIPDGFELNLNHRFGPNRTLTDSERWLRALVGAEAELEIIDASPPAPPLRDHRLIRAFEESGVLGTRPKLGWTDVARFAQLGVAAVNFGPGVVAQAHRDNEWTSIRALEQGRRILRAYLANIGA